MIGELLGREKGLSRIGVLLARQLEHVVEGLVPRKHRNRGNHDCAARIFRIGLLGRRERGLLDPGCSGGHECLVKVLEAVGRQQRLPEERRSHSVGIQHLGGREAKREREWILTLDERHIGLNPLAEVLFGLSST